LEETFAGKEEERREEEREAEAGGEDKLPDKEKKENVFYQAMLVDII
jgi:hypothetical protein